jgi:hypothetical protein
MAARPIPKIPDQKATHIVHQESMKDIGISTHTMQVATNKTVNSARNQECSQK